VRGESGAEFNGRGGKGKITPSAAKQGKKAKRGGMVIYEKDAFSHKRRGENKKNESRRVFWSSDHMTNRSEGRKSGEAGPPHAVGRGKKEDAFQDPAGVRDGRTKHAGRGWKREVLRDNSDDRPGQGREGTMLSAKEDAVGAERRKQARVETTEAAPDTGKGVRPGVKGESPLGEKDGKSQEKQGGKVGGNRRIQPFSRKKRLL